jgi:hypothetical protein
MHGDAVGATPGTHLDAGDDGADERPLLIAG